MTQYFRLLTLFVFLFSLITVNAQKLSPYTLGAESNQTMEETITTVKTALTNSGFDVLGEYQPAKDVNRWLIVVTSEEIQNAVKKVGDLTGFALALRVGITQENGKVNISYTTPEYWGNAYFQKKYDAVKSEYQKVAVKFNEAMKACGTPKNQQFGSKKGLDSDDLESYKYMIGMPKFHDTIELKKFSTYDEAIAKIEANSERGIPELKKVYEISIPEKNLTLYGFALLGEKGEEKFLPIIDIGDMKHTAFLPYEILVMNNEVHMLHGRYRIALSFPDLKMVTFTKIMSTPGDIEDLMKKLVE